MTVKQVSVFIENKPGQLSELANVLSRNDLDMRSLSIAESSDFGILRIIVDDAYNAVRVLKEAGYVCAVTSVLAAAIPDEPGGLCRILTLLDESGINLEYTYAFFTRQADQACMVFRVSDENQKKAAEILNRNGVRLFGDEELAKL